MPSWMGIAVLVVAGLFLARVTRARGCGGTGGFGRAALLIGGLVLGGILLSGHWSSRRDEARERAIAAADHERNVRFGYQRPSGDFGNIGVEEMKQYRAQVAHRARLAARSGDVAEAAEPETAAQPAPPQPKAPPAAPTPPAPATPQTPSKKVKFDAGPIKVEIDTDEESGMPSGDELTRAATSIVARATVEAVKHFTRASGEAAKRTAKELASAGSGGAKSGGTTASASSADAARVAESVSSASHDAASPTAHAAAADSASSAVASSASKRPSWLDESLGKQGAVYRTKVVVGPYKTRQECDRALRNELIESARAVIDRHIGGSNRIPTETLLPYLSSPRIFKEEFEEKKESETPQVGEMLYLHVLLEFDDRSWRELSRMQHEREIEERVAVVGIGAGWVMALLGTIFGYLKLDTLTRGYYTRRLQLVAGAVILTLIGAAVVAVS